MKINRFCFIVCLLLCCMIFSACTQTTKINLPFKAEEVVSVQMYQYDTPSNAEQKQLDSSQDISNLMDSISNIPVKKNHIFSHSPQKITSFRFHLADGTDFEVIYTCYGVKTGTIQSSYAFDYQTSSDVGGIWSTFDVPITSADEETLPFYDK